MDKQLIDLITHHFGAERLLAALPQSEVKLALQMVSATELADFLGLTYTELRWQMKNGSIPHPTHKLVRRCFYTQSEAESIKQAWKRKK